MKLVTYLLNGREKSGIYFRDNIYDLKSSAKWLNLDLPSDTMQLLKKGEAYMNQAFKVDEAIKDGKINTVVDKKKIKLLSPVPHPTSCRDGYAFRQHVEAARRNRGVEMIAEFDNFPIFYFTNHNAIFGEGDIAVENDHLNKLDFELEAAIVIGKPGRNIKAEDADNYIAGYMIMNDFSARYLQMEEMKLNLGPAKGKDFATSLGPWLVTPDELDEFKIETPLGSKYDLKMTARHNGSIVSEGNMKDMNFTFAEIIERASYGVDLLPGDVIGSGTVGTGCYLELNGTYTREAKEKGEVYEPVWLQDGDEIELEIENLGVLKNRIAKTENKYSLRTKNNASL